MIESLYALDPARARAEHDLKGKFEDPSVNFGLTELDDFDFVAEKLVDEGVVHILKDDDIIEAMALSKNPDLDRKGFRQSVHPILDGLTATARGMLKEDERDTAGLISVRAGLAFEAHLVNHFPNSEIGFITQTRDEVTSDPESFLDKMCKFEDRHALLVDPMLATGGSMIDMVNAVSAAKANKKTVVTAFTAVQGLVRVAMHPKVDRLITTPLEAGLTSTEEMRNFIYGAQIVNAMLGDFGDRYYGETTDRDRLAAIREIVSGNITEEEIKARFNAIVGDVILPSGQHSLQLTS